MKRSCSMIAHQACASDLDRSTAVMCLRALDRSLVFGEHFQGEEIMKIESRKACAWSLECSGLVGSLGQATVSSVNVVLLGSHLTQACLGWKLLQARSRQIVEDGRSPDWLESREVALLVLDSRRRHLLVCIGNHPVDGNVVRSILARGTLAHDIPGMLVHRSNLALSEEFLGLEAGLCRDMSAPLLHGARTLAGYAVRKRRMQRSMKKMRTPLVS